MFDNSEVEFYKIKLVYQDQIFSNSVNEEKSTNEKLEMIDKSKSRPHQTQYKKSRIRSQKGMIRSDNNLLGKK